MPKKPLKPKATTKTLKGKSKPATKAKPATPTPLEPQPEKPSRLISGDKDLALHYGRSTRTIQSWRDKGLPFKDLGFHKYQYDLDQTDPWVDDFTAGDESDGDSSVRKERERVKLAIDKELFEKVARENAEAKKNILPKDEYELHLVERNQLVRDALLNIPKQMRRHLGPKSEKQLAELTKLIEKALNQLADEGQDD
jgi:phage terminase Nu1 subunit (DNA packaging protein)